MKQQLKLDMEQQTSSKPGKEYVKAVFCHQGPGGGTFLAELSDEDTASGHLDFSLVRP